MLKIERKFCADDWGMSPSINDSIIDLIERELIYSVSIVVNGEFVDYRLDRLLKAQKENRVKLGLHFNLTYGKKYNSPFAIWLFGVLHLLDIKYIKRELLDQINLATKMNIRFDLIDGHHHVHLVPFVFRIIDENINQLIEKNIRFMIDLSHCSSYLQTKVTSLIYVNRFKKWSVVECGYLKMENLLSAKTFQDKMANYDLLIIHPAKYNDFHQINFNDKLKIKRIEEYEKIVEYCS